MAIGKIVFIWKCMVLMVCNRKQEIYLKKLEKKTKSNLRKKYINRNQKSRYKHTHKKIRKVFSLKRLIN